MSDFPKSKRNCNSKANSKNYRKKRGKKEKEEEEGLQQQKLKKKKMVPQTVRFIDFHCQYIDMNEQN